jgi:fructokinase
MSFSIGLDIGGTKIAGALFDAKGVELAHKSAPTPDDYEALLALCVSFIDAFDKKNGAKASIGVGTAGMIDRAKGSVVAPNIPCLAGKPFQKDLEKRAGRTARLANDADCAALAEATDGAGKGHRTVFGLILGTGVGGGLVIDGKIHQGPHGLAGEIGHLPLPFREAEDGPLEPCGCGQRGCIDKSISGPALARLYKHMTGKEIENSHHVVTSLRADTEDTKRVLDRYYTTVAKGLVTVIHAFDPDIIVVSGGLSSLPGLYDEVPKRWGKFALSKQLHTKLVPGEHGTMSGLRGAAMLGKLPG